MPITPILPTDYVTGQTFNQRYSEAWQDMRYLDGRIQQYANITVDMRARLNDLNQELTTMRDRASRGVVTSVNGDTSLIQSFSYEGSVGLMDKSGYTAFTRQPRANNIHGRIYDNDDNHLCALKTLKECVEKRLDIRNAKVAYECTKGYSMFNAPLAIATLSNDDWCFFFITFRSGWHDFGLSSEWVRTKAADSTPLFHKFIGDMKYQSAIRTPVFMLYMPQRGSGVEHQCELHVNWAEKRWRIAPISKQRPDNPLGSVLLVSKVV